MNASIAVKNRIPQFRCILSRWLLFCLAGLFCVSGAPAQTRIADTGSETIVVESAPEEEIIAFAKTVIVKERARGVLVFGGEAIIEGHVSGDVAVIGGSVIQREDAFIGGDIFVIGGRYKADAREPKRGKARETLVFAGYEDELRAYAQNPSLLFSPTFSWSFLIQRLFSLFFWFAVGVLTTLISPGAVSRAVLRYRLAPLNIYALGSAGFVLTTVGVISSVGIFPGFISGLIGIMAFVLIIMAYVFGRVVLQVTFGKWIIRLFRPNSKPAETLTIFIGALFWTVMLSLPYVWVAALFALFSASIGLILTVRRNLSWKSA